MKKLRPGGLQGNRFRIVLRDVSGDREAIETNLKGIAAQGVPNYFGALRFGFDGGNVEQSRALLALRIQQGLRGQTLPVDVMDEAGRPTGPLWGRGRVATTDQVRLCSGGWLSEPVPDRRRRRAARRRSSRAVMHPRLDAVRLVCDGMGYCVDEDMNELLAGHVSDD